LDSKPCLRVFKSRFRKFHSSEPTETFNVTHTHIYANLKVKQIQRNLRVNTEKFSDYLFFWRMKLFMNINTNCDVISQLRITYFVLDINRSRGIWQYNSYYITTIHIRNLLVLMPVTCFIYWYFYLF
jgi:hypothetical protein